MGPLNNVQVSYKEFIRSRAQANPCINDLANVVNRPPTSSSTIVLLEYSATHDPPSSPAKRDLIEADLSTLLQNSKAPPSVSGRILLVENIDSRTVELLGQYLDVDPIFFASHITTNFQGIDKAPLNPSLAFFPSQIAERGHLHIHYQQVVDLGSRHGFEDTTYLFQTNANVPRNTRRLPPLSGRQLALARSCCSVLLKKIGLIWYCKRCLRDG